MYFGSIGCFFVWNYNKHGSIYEKYKECNLISYRIGNEMIYTYKYKFEMRSNSICTFNNIDYF